MVELDTWYRYEDVAYSSMSWDDDRPGPSEIRVELREYRVIRVTPRGVWLDLGMYTAAIFSGQQRFVLRGARKRFACPTKAEAMESFVARKRRQLAIHKAMCTRVEKAIRAAAEVNEANVQEITGRE